MDRMIFTGIILLVLYSLLVTLTLHRISQYEKTADLVLPVRMVIKILLTLTACGVVIIGMFGGIPFYFFLIWSLVTMIGTLQLIGGDIIVNKEGITYLGILPKSVSWERIKTVVDHPYYFGIIAYRKLDTKQFLKFIWKIGDEDVRELNSLLLQKRGGLDQ
jgi:hypothetical protein